MGNSCCFKKPLPVHHPDIRASENSDNRPTETIPNTTQNVHVQPKSEKQKEQTVLNNNSEVTNFLKGLEQKKVAFMLQQHPEKDLLMSSATKPVSYGGKDGVSKDSGQTKYKTGELGQYRPGKLIYGSYENKYRIVECLDSETGKLFSLKMIEVFTA